MEPKIRVAEAADLATIHHIEMRSYTDPWPRSIFFLMQGRAPDLFLVAEAETNIVGYAIGEVEWRNGIMVGHIMNVAVTKAWRRSGIAYKLLDELENRFLLRGVDKAYLEVRASNVPAQRLYKKRRYIEIRILPRYYRDEDGLVMEKSLK